MAKTRKKLDLNQLAFDFDKKIKEYVGLKDEILLEDEPEKRSVESHEEACIEIAAAVKRAIRNSGLSREQVVDEVNNYFGWNDKSAKKLSIHIFNHYLSKPCNYPMPAYMIFAVQDVCGSLEPTRAFAESRDARVITGDEVRQMALGKLDETIQEMQRLKKDLRGRR